jgi:RNA polymerase sigma-70 factor (ECF subfamily)
MMDEALDEAALIERARRDPDAFAILYRRYLPPVYRYLLLRLGNVQDAEDLTSRVFSAALEGLANRQYQEGGKFAAWLFTIARRRLADHYRGHPTAPLDMEVAVDSNPLVEVQYSENQTRLRELLARLDVDKQELLRLRFAGELSFAEIAALEGKSEAAVKMAVYRTLDWLRQNWEVEDDRDG